MAAQTDPYVRVYYRVIDDPKFRDVFDDDARLACWLRLLLIADGTYPAPAPIPAGIKRAALAHLVSSGIIDLEPGGRYRVHGMEPERSRRSSQAEMAARKRWDARNDATAMRPHSASNAGASDVPMHSAPILSEPILSNPNRSATARADAVFDAMGQVENLTGGRPFSWGRGSPIFDTLAADVADLGLDRVTAEYRAVKAAADGQPIDAAGIVFGAHKRLYLIPAGPNGKTPKQGKGFNPTSEEAWDAFGGKP
jgi:hypothetical protein